MSKIDKIQVLHYKLPLEGNLVDALHGKHDFFELIITNVITDTGVSGTGYTYTGGIGGGAIANLLETDLKPRFLGKEIGSPQQMVADMNQSIHYVARGGIASFAISALDIALWDIRLKEKNQALADCFGTRQDKVRTYHGGIDLMFTEKELLESIEKQLKFGHTAVKIKLGKENEAEDLARVKAVRNLIGKDAKFAVDANMVWSVEQSIRMAKQLEEFDLFWLEEPTNPDDYLGYKKIAESTTIPIAMGENLHSKYEHELAFDRGAVTEIIPDCSNVCGITGFFDVATLAKQRNLQVNSHGMQELHVNTVGAVENAGLVEYHSFPIHQYCTTPLLVKDGFLEASKEIGTGVVFDYDKIKKSAL